MKCSDMISSEITSSNVATSERKISKNETKVFKIRDVEDDGNCLFRCFSTCLYGEEERHKEIRLKIVRYVARNWECFGAKVIAKSLGNTLLKWEFGTDLEIEFFSELYNVVADLCVLHDQSRMFSDGAEITRDEVMDGLLFKCFDEDVIEEKKLKL